VDGEAADAAAGFLLRVGHRHQLDVVRASRRRDEAFGAIDDEIVAVAHRARAHVGGIAAGVGFGLGKAKSHLAAQHRFEKSFLLFVVAMEEYRPNFRSEKFKAAEGKGSSARDLLVNNTTRQQSETRAAVFVG